MCAVGLLCNPEPFLSTVPFGIPSASDFSKEGHCFARAPQLTRFNFSERVIAVLGAACGVCRT
jgi:hypothetical protein